MPESPDRRSTTEPPHETGALPHSELTLLAIGASAGGLEACTQVVEAIPAGRNLALILVQHFDPTHKSLMVELLGGHTAMTVVEAANGMTIERDHLYVIPPGRYIEVANEAIAISATPDGHGARLPFDVLLKSVAADYGARAICLVLSGNGNDGTAGLAAINASGGYVIAQDPDEAEFDGMPRSAVATGQVDRISPLAGIADIVLEQADADATRPEPDVEIDAEPEQLSELIALLLATTGHDFALYKRGTIRRRVERRIGLAPEADRTMARYLETLRTDTSEREQLASDLLINVTSFFRDPNTFDYLAEKALPDLVAAHDGMSTIRVWCAGCSSGEETYTLAILLCEAIAASGKNIKLQMFASDVDADAVVLARAGSYPASIAHDVSVAHLAKYFSRSEDGYLVSSELRSLVVFSVQDILRDPPFSRLDMISCRNVLIYLGPEAQARALSLFHFALRPDGLLLLGSAETASTTEGRFKLIARTEKLYRQVGRPKAGEVARAMTSKPSSPAIDYPMLAASSAKPASLAELCRRLVLESFAPAAVLIDTANLCVYSLGPTNRYLQPPRGYPTSELLAMVPAGLRLRLKTAIETVRNSGNLSITAGGRMASGESFDLDIRPVQHEGQDLLLVCFIDRQAPASAGAQASRGRSAPRIKELERDLETAKHDLRDALHDLETTSEEQKAIDEEAMSVNEEYQSTNEELLTSKEELQSLNEELTALNSQLQETLERQRTTSNDLQNVLYSTDLATIFLDTKLQIRFFTPATRALFNIIQGDIGRPLSDLSALASDSQLLSDARTVLDTLAPIEREIETQAGAWFIRRILPYRTQDDGVEGVVITFSNITERRHTAEALEAAEREARIANIAKSRFLAAASHDLRQPLQSLKLVQGMLAKTVKDEKAVKLVARLDDTVGAMAGMLNSLLDINQIEAGVVQANISAFPIDDLLRRLKGEFTYLAQAQRLVLHVVPSSLTVVSDQRLLEQMVRNLLANALKYTETGKILLGCRRRGATLRIEIWDTGIGIAKDQLQAIFDEYHQIDNDARERSRGLGLGLSIVKRLGDLLAHPVNVRSRVGQGSAFTIEIPTAPGEAGPVETAQAASTSLPPVRTGTVLVIEDDPEIRHLLELVLTDEGHAVIAAADGPQAVNRVMGHGTGPDLVVADFNLPGGMDGVAVTADLRRRLGRHVPAIILTGDISTAALSHIGQQDCRHFTKPIRAAELLGEIQKLLTAPAKKRASIPPRGAGTVYLVDDDPQVRDAVRMVVEAAGISIQDFASAEEFLVAFKPGGLACLVVDAALPGMGGIDLVKHLRGTTNTLPTIMITGSSDVSMAVAVMKAGALDFIEKPVGEAELLAAIAHALEQSEDTSLRTARRNDAAARIASLTGRQREIMTLVLAGQPNKIIASDLKLSQRTVENHRAAIMHKTGARSLPALARLALAASHQPDDHAPATDSASAPS